MARSHVIGTLDVPWDISDAFSGLALDIGGSVIKLAYIDKDDWVEAEKREKGSKGKIRLSSFSREKLEDAFKFINSQVQIIRRSPTDIYTTGVGGSQLTSQIRKKLNVGSHNLSEMDCFVQAFVYLIKNYTREQVVHKPDPPAIETAKKQMKSFEEVMKKLEGRFSGLVQPNSAYTFQDDPSIRWDKPMNGDKSLFPCLLAMLGSGLGAMLVQEDGSFVMLDTSNRCGRMFLGQGALMTGVKTYDELVSLGEKGDTRGVSTTTSHITEGMSNDAEDIYTSMQDIVEMVLYSFGQAVGKDRDELKKQDIARGLLHTMALDIVQTNHLLAHVSQVKHVFFCGSFAQHPFVRQEIMTEWLRRDCGTATSNPVMMRKQKVCHFVKLGSHLGCLGAFLNSKLQFIKSPTTSEAPTTEQQVKPDQPKMERKSDFKTTIGL